MNIEMLVRADTSHYFRLQDLDNTAEFNPDASGIDYEKLDLFLPHTKWNQELLPVQREQLQKQWKGPYISFNNSALHRDLVREAPELFWGAQPVPVTGDPPFPPIEGGPIFITTLDYYTDATVTVPSGYNDRVPLDPWGNPYIFFATGQIYDYASRPPVDVEPVVSQIARAQGVEETDYKSAVIYSLGPDGIPGNLRPRLPANLHRDGYIGENNDPRGPSDDLEIIF